MIQRLLDLLFSIIAIIILSPLFIIVAVILRVTGEGEIFYSQERIGRQGHKIFIKKFATMQKNSPNIGTGTITLKNDPRVLPFGKLLRKTKINELPQLLNILKGDMSIIGPRPLTSETFSAYSKQIQKSVISVRPGLSGVGSIVFRDEEKLLNSAEDSKIFYRNIIAPYKGELECWYSQNNTTVNYFLLIFITIQVVCFPSSKLLWRLFSDLPRPSESLSQLC